MNKTIEIINRRASVRKFNDTPICEEEMAAIITSALRAPTAGNMVMYSIIKVKNKETLTALSKSCDNQPFIADADTALIFVADMNKWHKYFVNNGVKEYAKRTGRVYDGPAMGDFMLAINDALIASENSVIAAESFGIGSCYIGDIMENIEYHRDLLKLPEYVFPAAMLVFGHTDVYPQAKPRFDEKYVIFEEVYKTLNEEEISDMYDMHINRYDAKAMADFENFAQCFYNRKIGSEFFAEMNRSIKIGIEDWLK